MFRKINYVFKFVVFRNNFELYLLFSFPCCLDALPRTNVHVFSMFYLGTALSPFPIVK
jgi:hypothetical protein